MFSYRFGLADTVKLPDCWRSLLGGIHTCETTLADSSRPNDSDVVFSAMSPPGSPNRAIIDNSSSQPRLVGLSQPFFAPAPSLDTDATQREVMERMKAEVASKGSKVRVLVAEDNKVNQEVVLRMLKLEDIYDVTVAKDGQEAYELVKKSMEENRLFNVIFM